MRRVVPNPLVRRRFRETRPAFHRLQCYVFKMRRHFVVMLVVVERADVVWRDSLAAETTRKKNRPVEHCLASWAVRSRLCAESAQKLDFDCIARRQFSDIIARSALACRPERTSDSDAPLPARQDEPRAFVRREVGLEAQRDVVVFVCARNELVDIERVAELRIDETPQLRVAFHSTRLTAPERVVRAVLKFVRARHHREKVCHSSVARFDLPEDVVPKRPLLVVGDCRARLCLEELTRELEQIVGAARLAREACQVRALLVGPTERLLRGYASWRVEIVTRNRLPEELGKAARLGVARQLVAPHLADDLRNKRVGVLSIQLVAAFLQRIKNLGMEEHLRRLCKTLRAHRITTLALDPREIEQ